MFLFVRSLRRARRPGLHSGHLGKQLLRHLGLGLRRGLTFNSQLRCIRRARPPSLHSGHLGS